MKQFVFAIIIMIILFSCETKLDYTLPQGQSHLVVNSILNADADTILVNVSQSKPTAKPLDSNLFVNDATVELFENDNLLFSLLPRGEKGYYEANYQVKNNHSYTVRVNYGDEHAEAVTMVPNKPKFKTMILDTTGTLITGQITVEDNADEKNYYIIGVQFNRPVVYDTLFLPDTVFLYRMHRKNILRFIFADFGPIEAKLPGIVDGFAFSDKIFNGKTYTFHWYAVHVPTDTIFVQLYAIDESLYRFLDTFTRSEMANNNPFAQPADVYTNIAGGLGLLASLTYSEDTLVLYPVR